LLLSFWLWCFPRQSCNAQIVVDNDNGYPGTPSRILESDEHVGLQRRVVPLGLRGGFKRSDLDGHLAASGEYEVFVWYRPGSNRASSARYDVLASGGTQTVYVNR
jgi:hypothetical protein